MRLDAARRLTTARRSLECSHFLMTGTGGTTSTTGPGGNGGGGNGGDGGTPVNCVPSADLKSAVDPSCGVFVSASGQDGDKGTQEKPVKSFQQAVKLAQEQGAKQAIYACAEEFAEQVELPAGVTVYGGLDCSAMPRSWKYVGDKSKTTISSEIETIPLVLVGGSGTVKIEDLHVLAKPAENSGGSSIAVVANHVTAEITGCIFEAGDGKEGLKGNPYPNAAQGGAKGLNGGDACTANTVVGADAVNSMCGFMDSTSGLGGNGATSSGGNGSSGLPDALMNFGAGEGNSACEPGTIGDNGAPGSPGIGAMGLGSINKTGHVGVLGMEGGLGSPAQGGGGGGGAKGGSGATKCGIAPMFTGGAAGGSGGSGGCGGAGGRGGHPGRLEPSRSSASMQR